MFEHEDETERFFIPAHGADDEALAGGFRWLLEYAEEHACTAVSVWVPSMRQISGLGRVIGGAAQELEKSRQTTVGGIVLSLLTARTIPHRHEHGPMLAVWVDDQQLDSLDALRPPGLCAIPWNETDIEGWKRSWNPTDVQTGRRAHNEDLVGNTVLQAALVDLTAIVNVTTGITHPSDKAAAVQLFEVLRAGGVPFDPAEVKAFAVRHGWEPRHARDLASVAQRISEGKRVQTGRAGKMWSESILEKWRAGETL